MKREVAKRVGRFNIVVDWDDNFLFDDAVELIVHRVCYAPKYKVKEKNYPNIIADAENDLHKFVREVLGDPDDGGESVLGFDAHRTTSQYSEGEFIAAAVKHTGFLFRGLVQFSSSGPTKIYSDYDEWERFGGGGWQGRDSTFALWLDEDARSKLELREGEGETPESVLDDAARQLRRLLDDGMFMYSIMDENNNHIDGCCGFYSYNEALEEAIYMAEHLEERAKKQDARTRRRTAAAQEWLDAHAITFEERDGVGVFIRVGLRGHQMMYMVPTQNRGMLGAVEYIVKQLTPDVSSPEPEAQQDAKHANLVIRSIKHILLVSRYDVGVLKVELDYANKENEENEEPGE